MIGPNSVFEDFHGHGLMLAGANAMVEANLHLGAPARAGPRRSGRQTPSRQKSGFLRLFTLLGPMLGRAATVAGPTIRLKRFKFYLNFVMGFESHNLSDLQLKSPESSAGKIRVLDYFRDLPWGF